MPSYRKIIQQIAVLCLCTVFSLISPGQSNISNKLYGEAAILSNYIERGITQSDKGPSLQAGFGYQMGAQARIGIWGSSVKYSDSDATVNLRPHVDIKIDFSTNTNMVLRYDFDRYYSSGTRTGSVLSMDLTSFSYHGLVQIIDNWEGTHTGATWIGFRKSFLWPRGFMFTPTLGYTQISTTGYAPFLDTRMSVGYKFAEILYELSHTYNSSASQFNGRGDMAFILAVNVRF